MSSGFQCEQCHRFQAGAFQFGEPIVAPGGWIKLSYQEHAVALGARTLNGVDLCSWKCVEDYSRSQWEPRCLCTHAIPQTPGMPIVHDQRCEYYVA
jgi:hypothetical protein